MNKKKEDFEEMNGVRYQKVKFKKVTNIKLSLYPSKYHGRWKSVQKIGSAIIIYLHHCKRETVEYISDYILKYFLGEYLCSCIFRGNRFKKECIDRNTKKPLKIGCIPFFISNLVLRKLWNLPLTPIMIKFYSKVPQKQLRKK